MFIHVILEILVHRGIGRGFAAVVAYFFMCLRWN